MSCTIEKALADAKALVERLRDHDNAAESLIEQTTALNKRVAAMKQYQEEIQELNEVARHRPRSTLVMGIQQENRQIRELQQENKELRTSLEEHQSALELIMSKYREQMFRLLMASKKDDPGIIMKLKEQHSKELQVHVDQITEMAAVMRKAIEIDEHLERKHLGSRFSKRLKHQQISLVSLALVSSCREQLQCVRPLHEVTESCSVSE
uniref:FGFR1 oncogene partner 2 n=1 Tax=Monodelphis domestica TaxID=13616 RepID=F6Y9C6_MONDO